MVIVCCGDRNWTDPALVRAVLERLPSNTVLVHGDDGDGDHVPMEQMRGLDRMAGRIGAELGMTVRAYPAEWRRYRRGAGPKRNQQMLDEEHPDQVFAWHDDLAASRGTKDMVGRAMLSGVPVTLVSHANPEGELIA